MVRGLGRSRATRVEVNAFRTSATRLTSSVACLWSSSLANGPLGSATRTSRSFGLAAAQSFRYSGVADFRDFNCLALRDKRSFRRTCKSSQVRHAIKLPGARITGPYSYLFPSIDASAVLLKNASRR